MLHGEHGHDLQASWLACANVTLKQRIICATQPRKGAWNWFHGRLITTNQLTDREGELIQHPKEEIGLHSLRVIHVQVTALAPRKTTHPQR